MRKNRVKVSQTKPQNASLGVRTDTKALTLPKAKINNSDSFSLMEIPEEPSFQLPVRSGKIKQESDHIEGKSSSNEAESKSDIFDFDLTPMGVIGDMSDLDASGPKDLISQLKDLQNEITEMNQRIMYTEEEMRSKEVEAQELKELLIKLKENQVMVIETSEKQSNCKACVVF